MVEIVAGREGSVYMNELLRARDQVDCLGLVLRGQSGEVEWCSQCPAARVLPQASDPRAQAHSHCTAKEELVVVSSGIYVRFLTGLSFLNVTESYSLCF